MSKRWAPWLDPQHGKLAREAGVEPYLQDYADQLDDNVRLGASREEWLALPEQVRHDRYFAYMNAKRELEIELLAGIRRGKDQP